MNLSLQGIERIKVLRKNLDSQAAKDRQLVVSVDGSYTNENVLKNLPEKVTLIGRIRKDTVLNELPDAKGASAGRKGYMENYFLNLKRLENPNNMFGSG